ncbi:zinc finger BED domain-containing protein RICESLEEPER 2-like [Coffea arabica]|uniref:Zinc finger BED domain-containing protein RICESLEEPER 2-like n=2 Tax=Coffea arabica TaxID=13443 RepID=A0ABM4WQP6_COFAR|nr:zinc finger BED domain-containing protein RICESLEEPER 2-like [Coffea arabica]
MYSHQGSSTSPIMEVENEAVEQELEVESNADEMSEEELDLDHLDQPNEGTETGEKGAVEGANPFEKKQRKKKSTIWEDMTIVKQPDGTLKVQCNHCKELFVKNPSGATSQHKRHLKNCLQKRLAVGEENQKRQQVLSFTEGPSDGITSITNFSYDHAKVRELAAHMVLVHEYPFSMLDHVVFNKFMKAVSPFYKKINRQTVKEDCVTAFMLEKRRLRNILKGANRISITTDLWKSGQKIQYMVVTGHFVDSDWVLQKRVLNFCNVPPPHTGVIIADALSKCFLEWGIENKVSTITVDNASYNDVCIRRVKEDFCLRKRLSIGGKIFHVRCCAHILNLLVQDGLNQIVDVIDVVREGIKYLKNSESRLNEFAKIKKQLQLPSRKLILDCPTRWNSTYLMLASALEFRDVFPRYGDIDPGFHYVPSEFEWMKVEEVCKFLGIFYEITNIISGSDYPTANLFLVELYRIKELLNEKALDFSDHIRFMAESMALKFDKYWGESNVLMSLGAILDPRYKMVLVNHTFPVIYGEVAAPRYIDEMRCILYDLYNEYVDAYISSHSEEPPREAGKRKHSEISSKSTQGAAKKLGVNVLTGKEKFQMIVSEIDKAPPEKSDLDVYLEEGRYVCDANANLDVLGWWKGERWRFPILSRLASDILAIPVTTVASESTFSAGGRIIDDRRASMSVETVQMLLCGNDWIRNLHGLKNKSREPLDVSESSTIEEIDLPDI